MSVPVNLYVDRMSPVEPVRVADVYSVTQDRSSAYTEAAAKIGLTRREYAEFRQALGEGGAIFVRLPRHIDAMAGVHRRNGQVYALKNVIVPSGTMGWEVNLADGTTVIVPQICGNLSMNHSRVIAHHAKPNVVAMRQPKAVRAATYVAPQPAVVAETPVTFDTPPTVAPAGLPVAAAVASAGHQSLVPFLGLLAPIVASHFGGGGSTTDVPPCSAGSNLIGACRP